MVRHTDWRPLRQELRAWRDEGLCLPIWWGDDDATAPSAALFRLARMSRDFGVPVHLAVVPGPARASLAPCVLAAGVFRPVVHGWRHRNRVPERRWPSEFPDGGAGAIARARKGLRRLRRLFGASALPVFVPPWNHVARDLLPSLGALGYRAVSTHGPRPGPRADAGLICINTHVDVVEWQGGQGLADPDAIIAALAAHLAGRRAGACDATEPLGLLTHHEVQDDATWAFCETLLAELLAGPGHPLDLAAPGMLDPTPESPAGAPGHGRGCRCPGAERAA